MLTEILLQVLLVVGIIAVILLIANLWRLLRILKDTQEVADIANTRAKEIDHYVANIQKLGDVYAEAIKGFALSFGTVKAVKSKIEELLEVYKKKGEKSDE